MTVVPANALHKLIKCVCVRACTNNNGISAQPIYIINILHTHAGVRACVRVGLWVSVCVWVCVGVNEGELCTLIIMCLICVLLYLHTCYHMFSTMAVPRTQKLRWEIMAIKGSLFLA